MRQLLVKQKDGSFAWVPIAKRRTSRNTVEAGYPKVSYSLGGTKEDIPLAQAVLRAAGTSAEFTPGGDPIIRSNAHQRKVAAAFGMVNRDDTYPHGPQEIDSDDLK